MLGYSENHIIIWNNILMMAFLYNSCIDWIIGPIFPLKLTIWGLNNDVIASG